MHMCENYSAHTILMTNFTSRALYAVPRVHVQSEVYFGLNNSNTQHCFNIKNNIRHQNKHFKNAL